MNRLIRKLNPAAGPDDTVSRAAYNAGHILTETIPDKSPRATKISPEPLERTAADQRQSALLRLPIEVRRRIYDESFLEAGLARHVYVKDGRYTHTACVTDHGGPDERQIQARKSGKGDEWFWGSPDRSRRLLSSWANHWRCEEAAMAAAAKGQPSPTPFLAVLLSCKRMYLDCRQVLYERLTFVLHRVETALDFLSAAVIAPEIRSLHLSVQLDVEVYRDTGDQARHRLPFHSSPISWRRLRDRLPELDNLHHASVWMDSASNFARRDLLREESAFEFDECLAPYLRVSIPGEQYDDGTFDDFDLWFEPREYVVGRGRSQFWEEPDPAWGISWYRTQYPNSPIRCNGRFRRRSVLGEFSRWNARRK